MSGSLNRSIFSLKGLPAFLGETFLLGTARSLMRNLLWLAIMGLRGITISIIRPTGYFFAFWIIFNLNLQFCKIGGKFHNRVFK
jgi:hypothetical protein